MSLLSAGGWPGSARRALAQIAVLVTAVVASACASTAPVVQSTDEYAPVAVSRFAGLSPRPWVETEDDGREAQLPPRRRLHPSPDDPIEHFSPNYGSLESAPVPSQWTATVVRERA
ncbi:MAG: hypothetical protein GY877_05530 [Hyphomicrobium sp.]|nr:hypothetical protein [Hyphomicrobium sp.]